MREEIINNLNKKGYIKSSFLKTSGLTKEECYIIYHEITPPSCPVCTKTAKFKSFTTGYNAYCCMKCANTGKWTPESKANGNKKREEYYILYPEKKKEKSEKISKTNSVVWGSGTELRNLQIQKVKDGIGFAEINRKGRITKIEKYGHPCDFSTDYFKNIMIEKYGVENSRHIEGMSSRLQETFLETYGVKNSISLPGVREKSLETRRKNYLDKIEDLEDLERYISLVWYETKKNDLTILENFDKRGRIDLNADAYHLDHKYSICVGYLNNISPKIIGNIVNLEMLPALDNIRKRANCSISLDDLLMKCNENDIYYKKSVEKC